MPIFEYMAITWSGAETRGVLEAASIQAARRRLREENVHVVTIAAAHSTDASKPARSWRTTRFCRVRARELAVITRQLAALLRAGMPLLPALNALVEQTSGRPIAAVMARIRDRVDQGGTLAGALEEYPSVFSGLYVSMVRAGEAAGALEMVLLRQAELLEKRVVLMNRLRASLTYPVFMAALATVVIVFLLHYVVPSIAKLFLEMNRILPWPTLVLIAVSRFFEDYLWAMLLAGGGAFALIRLWIATPTGCLAWDGMKLRLPLMGDLLVKVAVARFARTLGMLLSSGVPLLDALGIVKVVVTNAALRRGIEECREGVRHGDSMANSLRRTRVFPPLLFHMLSVGEASGNVEEGLIHVADTYDNEVSSSAETLAALLEPITILGMGTVVGFIVLATLLPIFDISQAIR